MTDMPLKSKLVSGTTTEAEFQDALGDFYDVVNQLGIIGAPEINELDSSGNITPTKGNIVVDTESDAATDTLNLIVPTNIGEKMIFIRGESDARIVTLKHMASGTGRMYLNTLTDVQLKNPSYVVALYWDATASMWKEMWRNFGLVIPSGDEASARASLGLGTVATRDTGLSSGQVPLNSNLGSAAYVNTGVGSTQVPLNNQLGSLAYLSQVTNAQLDGTGVTPGTYSGVVVNAQGRVTGGAVTQAPIRRAYTTSTTWTKPAGCKYVEVMCIGGGGGGPTFASAGNAAAGGNTSFGAHVVAGGGPGGLAGTSAASAPGVGITGQILQNGNPGEGRNGGGTTTLWASSSSGGSNLTSFTALVTGGGSAKSGYMAGGPGPSFPLFWQGGAGSYGSGGQSGGTQQDRGSGGSSGGVAWSRLDAASLASTVAITIGAGGVGPNSTGVSGLIILWEYY